MRSYSDPEQNSAQDIHVETDAYQAPAQHERVNNVTLEDLKQLGTQLNTKNNVETQTATKRKPHFGSSTPPKRPRLGFDTRPRIKKSTSISQMTHARTMNFYGCLPKEEPVYVGTIVRVPDQTQNKPQPVQAGPPVTQKGAPKGNSEIPKKPKLSHTGLSGALAGSAGSSVTNR